jgi:two-component system, sensor histidine kinase PdtaS
VGALILEADRQQDRTNIRPSWFKIAKRLHDLPIWAHYALATALVLLTLVVRYSIVADHEGDHLLFFMPAILLTSTVLAYGSGTWAVLLSAVLVKAFFIPPPFSLSFTYSDDLLALVVFVGSGLVTAIMGGLLHAALFQLAAANEHIAASEHEKELLLHELAHRFRNDLTNLTASFIFRRWATLILSSVAS